MDNKTFVQPTVAVVLVTIFSSALPGVMVLQRFLVRARGRAVQDLVMGRGLKCQLTAVAAML